MNTNNTFTLTMPTDDPIALNAFSRALHEMAVAHGAPVVQGKVIERTETIGNCSVTEKILSDDELEALLNDRDHVTVLDTSVNPPVIVSGPEDITVSDLIDSEGLPWDERIHAGSKTRNQDGTWKARKKRQDMTAEEWSDYVTGVKAELKELMSVPVVTPPVTTPEPALPSDNEQYAAAWAKHYGDETSEPEVVPPVPAVEPPMPVPPVPAVEPEVTVAIEAEQLPPAPPVSDSVTTFPALMTWLTSHESVLTVERVNQVVQSHGLTELKQLIQRPDLIPQVFVTLSQEV
ncbi:MAG: hypothetical protein ACRDDY_18195 [Clostridium sp.]|uniref:hypothetical protein n=1 Tax=Clostridium sp. TaxID=1506 RepID=UPI003EE5ECBE